MIALLVFAALIGCLLAQLLCCRRFGLHGLAAATCVPLGGLYYLWLRTVAGYPADACEACRTAALTCGACEALRYAALGLALAGAVLIVTALFVGALFYIRKRSG